MQEILNEAAILQMASCKKHYEAGDYSKALEALALAAGLNQDMGPMEILEAIMNLKGGKELLLVHYSTLMYKALHQKGTLGRGMYRAWTLLNVDQELGKRRVTRPSPNAALYPYSLIYWNSGRCQELNQISGKNDFNIAESGAFLEKKTTAAFLLGVAIMMERYAYTYSRIGAADVNKIIVLLEELQEEDIPWEYRNAFERILPGLEEVKAIKNLKLQKQKLLKLAELIPIP